MQTFDITDKLINLDLHCGVLSINDRALLRRIANASSNYFRRSRKLQRHGRSNLCG